MSGDKAVVSALIDLDSSCDYLGGISKVNLYKLINGNKIQRVKIGRRSFITRTSLDQYVERLSSGAA